MTLPEMPFAVIQVQASDGEPGWAGEARHAELVWMKYFLKQKRSKQSWQL
jgi:hypothetical protein